jgi:hypothetical protein
MRLYENNIIGNVKNQPNTFGIKIERRLFIIPHTGKSNRATDNKSRLFFPKKEQMSISSAIVSTIYVQLVNPQNTIKI